MRRRMLSYKRWVRNWAESLNVLATVHQLDHSSKGKTHDIIKRHVTEHSLKFPELQLGSDHILKLSETIWHNPWAIFGNALNQFRYIFIHHIWHICETSIASHEPCAMIHIARAFRPLPSSRPWTVIEQITAIFHVTLGARDPKLATSTGVVRAWTYRNAEPIRTNVWAAGTCTGRNYIEATEKKAPSGATWKTHCSSLYPLWLPLQISERPLNNLEIIFIICLTYLQTL